MRIEQTNPAPVDQTDEYSLTAAYRFTFMGTPVGYPLLVDVAGPGGQLAFRLHLTADDVATITDAIDNPTGQ